MFCSTIIPTIARPSVDRAVASVLEQAFTAEDFEIIVVNDSGRPLPPAAWQQSERVQVIHTQRRERIVARNTGAALARGHYLHFLDDDDWLLPGALQSLWELAKAHPAENGAHWLYGSSQLVDRQGKPIIQLHHGLEGNCFAQVMAGEWIPLQASLISAPAFFAIGGFTPGVMVSQDVDLCRRIVLHGDLAGADDLVACIGMGTQDSSTDYEHLPLYSRWAREKILAEPGVFSRLRASAVTPDLRGRIARIYLTSVIWNLKRRSPFTAASRALHGAAALTLAAPAWVHPAFWKALRGRYISPTFTRGFEMVEKPANPPALESYR